MKWVLVAAAAAGCASGRNNPVAGDGSVDSPVVADAGVDTQPIDAPVVVDARPDASPDAPPDAPPDAMIIIDAPPDAPMIDAPPDACVPVVTELLANPAFDLAPLGTGWTEQVIDPMFPIVTGDDGIPEQSPPYKAWLGGFEAPTTSVTDQLHQDVLIPANTTMLVLTGYYEVRTGESPTDTNVYDTGQLALTQTNGTPIATVLSLSNRTPTTAWTMIDHTFAQDLSGQTVRLRMTTTNDFLNATSFYFDTLSLRATHCP